MIDEVTPNNLDTRFFPIKYVKNTKINEIIAFGNLMLNSLHILNNCIDFAINQKYNGGLSKNGCMFNIKILKSLVAKIFLDIDANIASELSNIGYKSIPKNKKNAHKKVNKLSAQNSGCFFINSCIIFIRLCYNDLYMYFNI